MITRYLSWGLARRCRGSSGSGRVSVRREEGRQGASHLQPMCLTDSSVREQIPLMTLCSRDHSNTLVCKEFPYPEGASKEVPLSAWRFLSGGFAATVSSVT